MKPNVKTYNNRLYGWGKSTIQRGGLLILLIAFSYYGMAQTVSGTITDQYNDTVIGATIVVDGTTIGTITDIDGNFSLNVPEGSNTLRINYLGMKETMVNIDGRSVINVVMENNSELIDEVVVIGYGVQKRSDLVGSVASLNSKDIKSIVAGSASVVLQGKMAGIQIETNGGAPGGETNVFVRGVSSLTNSFPLYVIDGTFADNMNFINSKDIESIEVLKDAASSAIYGSRAANGVVIISTKQGNSDGKTTVSLDMRTGIESPSKYLDLMDGPEFTAFRNQLSENDGTGFVLSNNFPNTDWQDLSLNPGAVNDIGLSVSGGGDQAKFFLSGNYFNQDGILVGSNFNRLNGRVNSQFKLGRLTINQSLSLIESNLQDNRWFGFDGTTAPILAETNNANNGGFEAPVDTIHGFGGSNVYGQASLEDNNLKSSGLFGNINLTYDITNDLNVKLNFGADKLNQYSRTFTPTYFMSSTDAVLNEKLKNEVTSVNNERLLTLFEPTINYATDIGNGSNVNIVLGYTEQKIVTTNNGVFARGTPNNNIDVIGAAPVEDIGGLSGFQNISGLRSLFGRVNYTHNNKYLLQATMRRDASSKFPEYNRVGLFPSVALGWKMHNENFFPQDGIISNLKLRAGYGTLGAQNIPDYSYIPTIDLTSGVTFGGTSQTGFAQTTFVDDSLKWEVAQTFNIGADFGLLEDKILLTAEYYIKNTDDVLVGVNVPSTSGTSNPIIRNAASIQNKGFEFEALYRNRTSGSGFNWTIGANLATFSSLVTELPNPIIGPSVTEDLTRVNRFIEGEAPGVYWGFETAGVYADQNAIESDANIANDVVRKDLVQPGDFIRVDQNNDGIVNNDDQIILGDPTPDFTYGINFTGSYKALDFGLFFNGVQGNEIFNMSKFFHTVWADGNKLATMNNAWSPTNTNTNMPRATAMDAGGNRAPSDFFVEDGSYLRLRTLEVGYTIGQNTIANWLGDLRVFVTGQNLLTLTGYSGYDPDVSSTNGGRATIDGGFPGNRPNLNPLLGRGIDVRAYPNTRTIMFGIQAQF